MFPPPFSWCSAPTGDDPDWSCKEPVAACSADGSATPANAFETHRVERGETLSEIAARYQLPVQVLAEANALVNVHSLRIGQNLRVPLGNGLGVVPAEIEVAPRDTLQQLASQHGTTQRQLANANLHAIRDTDQIRIGQVLWAPGRRQAPATTESCLEATATADHTPPVADEAAIDLALRTDAVVHAWQKASAQATQLIEARQHDAATLHQPAREAMQQLEEATRDLAPGAAAQVLQAALPTIEGYDRSFQSRVDLPAFGPVALSSLLTVLDHVAGTAEGDAAIESLARIGAWDDGAVVNSVARGAGAAYVMALARQPGIDADRVLQAAFDGMATLRQKAADDTLQYAAHMEELGWLVSNLGGLMTPAQLDKAIDDYTQRKGAVWQAQATRMKDAVADDGARLLAQANSLATPSPDRTRQNARARQTVEAMLNDPLSHVAITAAMRQRPEIAVGQQWHALLEFFSDAQYVSTAKLTDQARKLSSEFATAYVKRNVLQQLAGFDPANTASVQQARAAFEAMKSSRFAALLGVPQRNLDKAVSALQALVPEAGTSPEDSARQLARLDKTLQGFKGFDKSTSAGRLIRCTGIALAGVGFLASFDRMRSDASVKNEFKVIVDAAGLGQKGLELTMALNRLDKESALGKLGGTAVGKFLGAMTAVYDLWNAGEALQQSDPAKGALYGLSASGGLMAAYGSGITGPVGFMLVGGSVFGLGLLTEARRAKRHEPMQDGGASLRFLQHAGLAPHAAHTLADQSPDGHSVVPLLLRYAHLKGHSAAGGTTPWVHWLNSLDGKQLGLLCNNLQATVDELEGQVDLFKATASTDQTHIASIATDPSLTRNGKAMMLPSAGQLDAVLAALGLPPAPNQQ